MEQPYDVYFAAIALSKQVEELAVRLNHQRACSLRLYHALSAAACTGLLAQAPADVRLQVHEALTGEMDAPNSPLTTTAAICADSR